MEYLFDVVFDLSYHFVELVLLLLLIVAFCKVAFMTLRMILDSFKY